jgi:hypothetical protein
LLNRLDEEWRGFRESFAGLPEAEMTLPGVTGNWSVKDILAHVTTWEEEAIKYLPVIAAGKRPPRYLTMYGGIDAFNARMTGEKAKLSLDEVVGQFEAVHARLVALVQDAPADQVAGDTRWRRRLRADTYGHYPRHAEAIRRWRNRSH